MKHRTHWAPTDVSLIPASVAYAALPADVPNVASWAAPADGNWLSGASWSPNGVPTASTAATIAAAGTYTVTIGKGAVAQSLHIDDAGVTVLDTGSLSLDGQLHIADGQFTLDGGLLQGATISNGTGGTFTADGGTLSSDHVRGTINFDSGTTVLKAVTFAGAGGVGRAAINLARSSHLFFNQTETLDNAKLIGFDATIQETDAGGTLTFGQKLTVDGTPPVEPNGDGGINVYVYSAFVNNGTITGDVTIGARNVINYGFIEAGSENSIDANETFTNYGTIDIDRAEYYRLDGTLTNEGVIKLSSGGTLSIGGDGSSLLVSSVDVTNGALQLNSVFNGTTAVHLQAHETLELSGGGTFAENISGAGTLALGGGGGDLNSDVLFHCSVDDYSDILLSLRSDVISFLEKTIPGRPAPR